MAILGSAVAISRRQSRVTFENPAGPPVSDGDGGWITDWTPLNPPMLDMSIAPATASDLERVAAGTVLSTASHILKGPYHPGVTTQTRIVFNGRTFSVTGVSNPEERSVEMHLVCVELVP